MHDIDFDELDRAVHSAITASGDEEPEHAEPLVTQGDKAVAAEHAKNKVASPAARRTGGRFMDVVHPSSDMRAKGTKPAAQTGTPAKPATNAVSVDDNKPSQNSSSFHWPDPLDLQPAAKAHALDDAKTDDNPLESPFISDAKVEKRPLGGHRKETSPEDAALEKAEEPAVPVRTVDTVEDADLEMSEETLIGSEDTADTSPEKPPVKDIIPESVASAIPLDEKPAKKDTPKKEESKPVKLEDAAEKEAPAPLAVTSIPQQYKEQKSSHDQESGSIYDTESYHQPLIFPHKKKSSIGIILWIVGLIVLGGGLGAAMYFFVLPML